jgi:Protein of unknown function (DUF2800)
MPGLHAIHAPSSAKRWINCTASATAISKLGIVDDEDEDSPSTLGTKAHDEIDRLLGSMNGATIGGGDFLAIAKPLDPNHFAAFGIGLFYDYVRQLVTASPGVVWVEQRVFLTNDIWGRLDFAHWDEVKRILTIVDYKNGYVPVEAGAEQLMVYAAAIIYTMQLRGVEWVRLVVVQPNDFRPVPRVKQHVITAAQLYDFANKAVTAATGPKTFTAGEHCRYCPLFGRCEATRDLLTQLSNLFARRVEDVPADMIEKFLICKKPIEDYFKNLEKHATKVELKTPGSIEGMKLVTSNTHRAWNDPAAARRFIVDRFGTDVLDIPSPAQVETLGVAKDEVNKMASKPEGGPVLAFAKDARKPFVRKTVQEMFATSIVGIQVPS